MPKNDHPNVAVSIRANLWGNGVIPTKVLVTPGGDVLVWDKTAKRYTRDHALSQRDLGQATVKAHRKFAARK
jgi:hypothetical protein